jgi:hypothetical protein
MPAQVVSFLRRARPLSRDWSQDELAEFYRVESALLQAGMRIETERGMTDEGDPWFAFCRADDGETFIHFARIDGRYIIAGPAYEGVAQGYDFPGLVRDLISRHPLVQPTIRRNNTNIFMHPAALLIAVVGTAFFKTADAKAAETSSESGDDNKERRHIGGASPATVPAPSTPGAASSGQVSLDAAQTRTLVASAMAAMTPTPTLGKTGGPFAPLAAPALEVAVPTLSLELRHDAQPDHAVAQASGLTVSATMNQAASVAGFQASLAATAEMGAWLSLTAVLQDLPRPTLPPAADALTSVLALLPNDVARHSFQAVELGSPPPPSKPVEAKVAAAPAVLVVELSSAALPNIAAIRLVRDIDDGSQDMVLKLEQLPDILAQLIARGEHLETAPTLPVLPDLGHPQDAPSTVPPLAPATGGDATPVVLQPADPAPAYPAAQHNNAAIDGIVTRFLSHTAQTEVVLTGHDIVLYDARIMTDPNVLTSAQSVTFTFADGSSVNLVGPASTLHDIGALH